MLWLWFVVLFARAAPEPTAAPALQPDLTVSAAISLTNALEAIAPVYARTAGARIRFNFGSSNALARQIVNGAPVDVFISADEAQMNMVDAAGAIVPGTRVDLLSNRLAIVTPSGRGAMIRDVRGLTAPEIRRIAIGDPAAVPAGRYARQYLEAAGLWTRLQSRMVPSSSVRAAAVAVENGAVDAGIVYESDTASTNRLNTAVVVPAAEGPRIVYPAAIVAATKQRAGAERFLRFLRGKRAAQIFRRFRFTPLPSAGR